MDSYKEKINNIYDSNVKKLKNIRNSLFLVTLIGAALKYYSFFSSIISQILLMPIHAVKSLKNFL